MKMAYAARAAEDAVPYDRDALHPVGRDAHIAPGHGTDPEKGSRGRRPLQVILNAAPVWCGVAFMP